MGDAPGPAEQRLEQELRRAVQAHRRGLGLPALRFDPRLDALARAHSQAIAAGQRPLSHAGFEQRADRLRRWLGPGRAAENVGYARGFKRCAPQLLADWLASPEHRRHLEDRYTHSGLGAALHGDRCLATQLFAEPSGE